MLVLAQARWNPSTGQRSLREFFDEVAAPDQSTVQHAAQHAPASPQLFAQPGPDSFHLIARCANRGDFETRLADAQELADLQRSEEHTSELQSLRHLVCRL